MEIPGTVTQLIEEGPLAHVTTLNRDGSPDVSLAWVGLEDGEVVMGTLGDQRKLRNVRRDPRVALSFHTDEVNDFGLTHYVVLLGSGRVTEGGAPELLQRLAYTYLGPGVKFPPMPDPPPGFVTRVEVNKIKGIGPWSQGR